MSTPCAPLPAYRPLQPTFHPRDTRKAWEWHIRNLPYPEVNRTKVTHQKVVLVDLALIASKQKTVPPRFTRQHASIEAQQPPQPFIVTFVSRCISGQETYRLSVDEEKGALVLRTSNKKYFKVFKVPSLIRAGIPLQQPRAKLSHDGRSTLVISYTKPDSIVNEERKARKSATCKK